MAPRASELKYAFAKQAQQEAKAGKPVLRLNGDGVMIFDKEKVYRLLI